MYRTLLQSLPGRKQCGWEIFLGEINISRCCIGLPEAKTWATPPKYPATKVEARPHDPARPVRPTRRSMQKGSIS